MEFDREAEIMSSDMNSSSSIDNDSSVSEKTPSADDTVEGTNEHQSNTDDVTGMSALMKLAEIACESEKSFNEDTDTPIDDNFVGSSSIEDLDKIKGENSQYKEDLSGLDLVDTVLKKEEEFSDNSNVVSVQTVSTNLREAIQSELASPQAEYEPTYSQTTSINLKNKEFKVIELKKDEKASVPGGVVHENSTSIGKSVLNEGPDSKTCLFKDSDENAIEHLDEPQTKKEIDDTELCQSNKTLYTSNEVMKIEQNEILISHSGEKGVQTKLDLCMQTKLESPSSSKKDRDLQMMAGESIPSMYQESTELKSQDMSEKSKSGSHLNNSENECGESFVCASDQKYGSEPSKLLLEKAEAEEKSMNFVQESILKCPTKSETESLQKDLDSMSAARSSTPCLDQKKSLSVSCSNSFQDEVEDIQKESNISLISEISNDGLDKKHAFDHEFNIGEIDIDSRKISSDVGVHEVKNDSQLDSSSPETCNNMDSSPTKENLQLKSEKNNDLEVEDSVMMHDRQDWIASEKQSVPLSETQNVNNKIPHNDKITDPGEILEPLPGLKKSHVSSETDDPSSQSCTTDIPSVSNRIKAEMCVSEDISYYKKRKNSNDMIFPSKKIEIKDDLSARDLCPSSPTKAIDVNTNLGQTALLDLPRQDDDCVKNDLKDIPLKPKTNRHIAIKELQKKLDSNLIPDDNTAPITFICERCRDIWNDKVLKALFVGDDTVTVNSHISYGAIVLIVEYARNFYANTLEKDVRELLERADFASRIGGICITDLDKGLRSYIKNGSIVCCNPFRPSSKAKSKLKCNRISVPVLTCLFDKFDRTFLDCFQFTEKTVSEKLSMILKEMLSGSSDNTPPKNGEMKEIYDEFDKLDPFDYNRYFDFNFCFLNSRGKVLLIPNGNVLASEIFGIRDNEKCNEWDSENMFSAFKNLETSRFTETPPTVREVLTKFCFYRNFPQSSSKLPALLKVMKQLMELSDVSDCVGKGISLYKQYCEFAFNLKAMTKTSIFLSLLSYQPIKKISRLQILPIDSTLSCFLSDNYGTKEVVDHCLSQLGERRLAKRQLSKKLLEVCIFELSKRREIILSKIPPEHFEAASLYAKEKAEETSERVTETDELMKVIIKRLLKEKIDVAYLKNIIHKFYTEVLHRPSPPIPALSEILSYSI